MFLDYTDDERALRAELRAYFAELFSEALHDEVMEQEVGGPLYRAALAQLAEDGWLGVGWPKQYGGQARSPMQQFIFFDEVQRAGFPISFLTLNTVGPTLMKFGTEEQRQQFLPRILAGEVHFAIGYTEPSAGTDLASLTTAAKRDGDEYVINGQKVFTSQADVANYLWLACRTDPEASKHKGISILIVPMDSPGLQITRTETLGENHVFSVFLEDVRVPTANLVGEENGGWRLITSQLNHERVALFPVGPTERFYEETLAWARQACARGGGKVIDQPWVQQNFAKVYAGIGVLRQLNWRQAYNIQQGGLPPQEASMVKVYGSEFYVTANRLLMEVLGEAGTLKHGSPGAVLAGRLERYYRATLVLTFGGGVNEVQRDIICMVGLGMPRPPR